LVGVFEEVFNEVMFVDRLSNSYATIISVLYWTLYTATSLNVTLKGLLQDQSIRKLYMNTIIGHRTFSVNIVQGRNTRRAMHHNVTLWRVCNPFQAHKLQQSYHPTQLFKQEKYTKK